MTTKELAKVRFFVDQTSLGLGRGLASLREDVIHTGHKLIPEVPLGALDPEWMPIVADLGLVVITRDKRIRTKHAKVLMMCESGLRVFVLGGKRDLTNWEAVCLLVRQWDAMEKAIENAGAGPWVRRVHTRITPMPIPGIGSTDSDAV